MTKPNKKSLQRIFTTKPRNGEEEPGKTSQQAVSLDKFQHGGIEDIFDGSNPIYDAYPNKQELLTVYKPNLIFHKLIQHRIFRIGEKDKVFIDKPFQQLESLSLFNQCLCQSALHITEHDWSELIKDATNGLERLERLLACLEFQLVKKSTDDIDDFNVDLHSLLHEAMKFDLFSVEDLKVIRNSK